MNSDHPLQVAGPNIHSKVFDDEVVVLDMASGMYFSLRGAAVDIWALVQARAARSQIVAALIGRYESPGQTIEAATDRCVAELLEAGLVAAAPGTASAIPSVAGQEPARRPFPLPEIERYTDMRELLRLDPIHEVDDWPNAPRRI
jgi:hypothetical protein